MCEPRHWHIETNLSTTRLRLGEMLITYLAFYSRIFRKSYDRVAALRDAKKLKFWFNKFSSVIKTKWSSSQHVGVSVFPLQVYYQNHHIVSFFTNQPLPPPRSPPSTTRLTHLETTVPSLSPTAIEQDTSDNAHTQHNKNIPLLQYNYFGGRFDDKFGNPWLFSTLAMCLRDRGFI